MAETAETADSGQVLRLSSDEHRAPATPPPFPEPGSGHCDSEAAYDASDAASLPDEDDDRDQLLLMMLQRCGHGHHLHPAASCC